MQEERRAFSYRAKAVNLFLLRWRLEKLRRYADHRVEAVLDLASDETSIALAIRAITFPVLLVLHVFQKRDVGSFQEHESCSCRNHLGLPILLGRFTPTAGASLQHASGLARDEEEKQNNESDQDRDHDRFEVGIDEAEEDGQKAEKGFHRTFLAFCFSSPLDVKQSKCIGA